MGRFGHDAGLTHTQRYHSHYKTAGMGQVYQGRIKSFPVQSDELGTGTNWGGANRLQISR